MTLVEQKALANRISELSSKHTEQVTENSSFQFKKVHFKKKIFAGI